MTKEKNIKEELKTKAPKDSKEIFSNPLMQGYERMYKDAEKKGDAKQVSHEFYQWEEEGQVLIGRLLEFDVIESKEYEKTYYRYIFDTDDGLMGVICGAMFDRMVDEKELVGKVLRIEYQGQRQLDGGRTVNRYKVHIIA